MIDKLHHGDGVGSAMMVVGTTVSWAMFVVDWIDGHSGFFVALAAIVSTVITIVGAVKAKNYRRRCDRDE